jgi:hypothetical protein
MTLSHTLKRIRLNLARSKECPSGSSRHGYELVAPLDQFGHIDPHLWQGIVISVGYSASGMARTSKLVVWSTKPEGAEHARWLFGYLTETWMDEQSGYRFGAHKFSPGEYASIHDNSGGLHTFQVTSVQPNPVSKLAARLWRANLGPRGRVRQAGDPDKLIEHKEYIARYGDDLPEITDSRWGQEAASAAVRSTEADNV